MGNILLVEDDEALGQQVVQHLMRIGMTTVWKRRGHYLDAADCSEVDLIVLDLMLPGVPGLEILKHLRELSEVPVLVLSARQDTHVKVQALQLGADDYMTKPFWPEELVDRVRARLRRPVLQRSAVVRVGALSIDVERREVHLDDQMVELTRVELDLLAALARRPGTAVSRQWLRTHVLDPEREANDRTLDVHVSRLRKKLGDPSLIETVWGIGYRLRSGEPS